MSQGQFLITQFHGYDYGAREVVDIVVDLTFIEHMKKCTGMGFGKIPRWGLFHEPLVLLFVFEDLASAHGCFKVFNDWITSPEGDGDTVAITFIEFDDDSYGSVVGPEMTHLINQSIPEKILNEVDPISQLMYRMIHVPNQSGWYRWFKSSAEHSPFVVMPATKDGPIENLAFRKRNVEFLRAEDVPSNHPAYFFTQKDGVARRNEYRPVLEPDGLYERRKQQLKRFFPVTLERLLLNQHFEVLKQSPQLDAFSDWELRQAVCNLTLKYRAPELFATIVEGYPQAALIEFHLDNPEIVDFPPLPDSNLSIEALFGQALANRRYLLDYVSETVDSSTVSDEDVSKQLADLGFTQNE